MDLLDDNAFNRLHGAIGYGESFNVRLVQGHAAILSSGNEAPQTILGTTETELHRCVEAVAGRISFQIHPAHLFVIYTPGPDSRPGDGLQPRFAVPASHFLDLRFEDQGEIRRRALAKLTDKEKAALGLK